MKKNLLLDLNNLYSRVKYAVHESDTKMYVSLVCNGVFNMIRESYNRFTPDNVIAFCDGHRSWRKNYYPRYKANRVKKDQTPKEIEQDEAALEFLRNGLVPLLKEKTAIPVIDGESLEADDLIATFVFDHRDDYNVIATTDNDFVQLLDAKTVLYNSMTNRLITCAGVYDLAIKRPIMFTIKDGKITTGKLATVVDKDMPMTPYTDWIEYALFMKCIRGDASDNIESAYPRAPEKSSKNRIGLREAFESRYGDGYAWNSMMKSTWKDLVGQEYLVETQYLRNKKLIDLKELPEDLRTAARGYIKMQLEKEVPHGITMYLSKFLNKYECMRMLQELPSFSKIFTKGYCE